jgi:hypothetical protein
MAERMISHSKFTTFGRCGEQARFRYIDREQGAPPTLQQIRGRVVHAVARFGLAAKRDRRSWDVKRSEIAADGQFDIEMDSQGWRLTADDDGNEKKAIGRAKDLAVEFSRMHTTEILPGITPTALEVQVEGTEKSGLLRDAKLVGVMDVVDSGGIIRDLKTAHRAPAQAVVNGSTQMTAYAILHRLQYGRAPSALIVDTEVITPSWPGPRAARYVQSLPTIRTVEQENLLLEAMGRVVEMEEKGVLPPPAVTGRDWWCSQRYCDYTGKCRFYNKAADAGVRE